MAAAFDGWWRHLQESYEESVHKNGDVRVQDWFLVYSPWPTISLCLGYLVMCLVGPRIMANRKPLELKSLLVVYNFALTVLSLYMFFELFLVSRHLGYNYVCDLVEYKTDAMHMRLASAVWFFYFSKLVEFLDTVFFILRKKNSQITLLHVYHHSTMPFIWWISVKWFAGGMAFFSPMLNCMVHVLMYGYYGLSVFPSLRKYLWWKRYLTILQLAQFLFVIVLTVYNLSSGCGYDKRVQWTAVLYLSSLFLLFLDFYRKSYVAKKTLAEDADKRIQADVNEEPKATEGAGTKDPMERQIWLRSSAKKASATSS